MSAALTSSRLSRRRVLKGSAAFGVGLAGAALIGCSSGEAPAAGDSGSNGSGTGASTPAGSAAAMPPREEREGVPVLAGEPTQGGVYTAVDDEIYSQHDQHTAVSSSEWVAISERALELDEWTGELRANIVESWEVVDPTHLTMKVREGVRLHNKPPWDGREFDAEDLAWNLNRISGMFAEEEGNPTAAYQRSSMLVGLDRAEAVDSHTVSVTLTQPTSTFFNGIAEGRNMMMPREIVDFGFEDPEKFAGLGAYQIVEYSPGTRVVYERNPDYYIQGQPYMDRLEQVLLPDRAAMMASFISRQTTIFANLTAQEIDTIQDARPDALFYSGSRTNWQYFMPNLEMYEPFADFRVRKALQLAINFQEIGDGFHGPGWSYCAVFHPAFPEAWPEEKVQTLPGYNPDTKEEDRQEAARLLEAAGFPNGDGLEFVLHDKRKPDNRENSIRFQAQMRELFPGMAIELQQATDTADFNQIQAGRNFQMISNDNTMVPDIVLEGISRFHSEGSRNYGNWVSEETDEMLDRAVLEVDYEARKELMDQFQEKWFNEWQPLILNYGTPIRAFLQPDVGGYDMVFGPWEARTPNKVKMLYYVEQ